MTKEEIQAKRLKLIEARRTIWECYSHAGDDAELKRICRERGLELWEESRKDQAKLTEACNDLGILLWEDELNDDEKLKDACREADIVLLEDVQGEFVPGDPVTQLAAEVAFNPNFMEVARAIHDLREELRRRCVFSRTGLDLLNLGG